MSFCACVKSRALNVLLQSFSFSVYVAAAHMPNHVTHGYRVKNNYMFVIPDPDLSIYCATSASLQ